MDFFDQFKEYPKVPHFFFSRLNIPLSVGDVINVKSYGSLGDSLRNFQIKFICKCGGCVSLDPEDIAQDCPKRFLVGTRTYGRWHKTEDLYFCLEERIKKITFVSYGAINKITEI